MLLPSVADQPVGGRVWRDACDEVLGELVEAVVAADRAVAAAQAVRVRAIEAARNWAADSVRSLDPQLGVLDPEDDARAVRINVERELARRSLVAEIACALRVPEVTTGGIVHDAQVLVEGHPATLGSLEAGQISYRHAEVILESTTALDAPDVLALEAVLVERAQVTTVSGLRRFARRERERTHPRPLLERHREQVAERRVELDPARDGMMWLQQYLPAVQAAAIYNRLTDTAASLQGPSEPRTLAQLRADVFTALLLDDDASTTATSFGDLPDASDAPTSPGPSLRGIRPTVAITVPVMTLLGHDTTPGHLEGYGPIDPDTARDLASRAPSFTRLLTHPETGTILSVGRDRYTVPADLKTLLRLRDETCRFPGCQRRAARCDIDHITDWAHGGHTTHTNLIHLCRHHHRIKHHTPWTVTTTPPPDPDGDTDRQGGALPGDGWRSNEQHTGSSAPSTPGAHSGSVTWTSPSGRTYTDHPAMDLATDHAGVDGASPALRSATRSPSAAPSLPEEPAPQIGEVPPF